MKIAPSIAPIMLAALLVSACGNNQKADTETKDTTVAVKIETTKPDTTTKAAAPAASGAAAIATQSGPNGFEVDLTRADVNGSILTVEFKFRNGKLKSTRPDTYESISASVDASDVNYIDDATAKKYTVLKDEQGKFMASPMQSPSTTSIYAHSDYTGTPAMVYFRFPAPPAGTKTISISLPGAGAFNAVPVTFK